MDVASPGTEWVTVGRVLRPHGIRGHVVVAPETDFVEERFKVGASVWIERAGRATKLTVSASHGHDGRPIVGFLGIESMDDAETLRGAELRVPESELPELPAGTFWVHQLVGCRVWTVSGLDVGEVRRVEFTGPSPLFVVSLEAGVNEVLVPMVDAICKSVDAQGKRIVIDPPAGLLDVNVIAVRPERVRPKA